MLDERAILVSGVELASVRCVLERAAGVADIVPVASRFKFELAKAAALCCRASSSWFCGIYVFVDEKSISNVVSVDARPFVDV